MAPKLCAWLQVYLKPRAIYKDPFRGGENILVMCDTYEPPRVKDDNSVTDPVPLKTNTRHACAAVMEKAKGEVPPPAPLCCTCRACHTRSGSLCGGCLRQHHAFHLRTLPHPLMTSSTVCCSSS